MAAAEGRARHSRQKALRGRARSQQPKILTHSDVECPHCGAIKRETMPTNACQILYVCGQCGATLRPKAGDCCIFCSYGSVPCPPVQEARSCRGECS